MESILVSDFAVVSNLRRAASEGLLSSLTTSKLNELALKYFGIYENGELVGYQCPYSGKKITNPKKIVLEHIIPISRGGGTVLFNCIPTSVEVNKANEKGTKHLISWWKNPDCKYWNKNAPVRLEKIINYLMEAYEITINGENLENNFIDSYEEDNYDNDIDDSEADLSTTQEDEQKKNKNESIITYYGLMNDLISALSEYTDVSKYQAKLQNLIKENVFEKIKRQTLIQKYLKDIIKNKLEIEDRSELTYTLNINISKLSKSLEKYSDNEIYSILEERINNLELILNNNNLSLDSFFTDKNSLIYLYKDSNELTETDITNLIENINMSVADKFNAMIEFVNNNHGVLPSDSSKDEKEQKLGGFRARIQVTRKKTKFITTLTKTQLQYLYNSEYESLREIYKSILYKAVVNDIEIEYVDEKMKSRILEYKTKLKLISSLDEEIELEKEYKDVIIVESQFNEFMKFVNDNYGGLPSASSEYEKEQKLGRFKYSIQGIGKEGNFSKTLTKTQLQYLHDSEYEVLREIYKNILYKAVVNDIEIEYVDEKMKSRILEYKTKLKLISSLEEEIELEKEYKDVIIVESQFNEFMEFVNDNYGVLPSVSSKNEKEQKLGQFRNHIQNITKKWSFHTILTKTQLQYLHDSEYESLREIYKNILYKAVVNNKEIEYVDEKMKSRILEYKTKLKLISSLDEEIELEKEYKDVIIVESQFNEFMGFVITNSGVLPKDKSKNEKEKQLGNFRRNIQGIKGLTKKRIFSKKLTKMQLQYLHNSEYESLREIYKSILYKAVMNDIEIEYVDEKMKSRILEYKTKLKLISSLEEEIELEKEYKDVIIVESQFNEFMKFVNDNYGVLPSAKSKKEEEKKLGGFRNSIQKTRNQLNFTITLTKSQLQYLRNSEYESLRKIYDTIMEKAISINYEPYIEINNEIELERRKVA